MIDNVKKQLLNAHDDKDVNTGWSEGYLSALVDNGYITEGEFEELMNWLKTGE